MKPIRASACTNNSPVDISRSETDDRRERNDFVINTPRGVGPIRAAHFRTAFIICAAHITQLNFSGGHKQFPLHISKTFYK